MLRFFITSDGNPDKKGFKQILKIKFIFLYHINNEIKYIVLTTAKVVVNLILPVNKIVYYQVHHGLIVDYQIQTSLIEYVPHEMNLQFVLYHLVYVQGKILLV